MCGWQGRLCPPDGFRVQSQIKGGGVVRGLERVATPFGTMRLPALAVPWV